MLTQNQISILRTLADQCITFAKSDDQLKTQELWAALNNGKMIRPMITIDQIPWHEMDVDGSLVCQIDDPYWRGVEYSLRQYAYRIKHMPADMVLPPYIMIPRILNDPKFRRFGLSVSEDTAFTDSGNDIISHSYINQFEKISDVEKIQFTDFSANEEAEARVMDEADKIFGGIAPVYFEGVSLHLGLWDTVAEWMSVEECYINLLDEPELLHAIMDRVTNVALSWIESGNKQGLFDTASAMTHCSCTLTAPFADKPVIGTSDNAWAFSMAQLFTSVAPSVTDEFEVAYMTKLFKHFSKVYYGCCERLDDRLDIITKMPNLAKVSCSPWSDRENFAQKLPKHLIMSQKPNPAFVGGGAFDENVIRNDLRATIAAAKNGNVGLEFLLKDNSTLQYEPDRLWKFSKIAIEEAQKW